VKVVVVWLAVSVAVHCPTVAVEHCVVTWPDGQLVVVLVEAFPTGVRETKHFCVQTTVCVHV
jgi:hypothetical protein